MHDRLIAREFELDGNTNRLVTAIAEESDVPLLSHRLHLTEKKAYAEDICQRERNCKGT